MTALVLVCGKVFDGVSDALTGPAEILVDENRIAQVGPSVEQPAGARVIDLSERTVSPASIDTHVHLTMASAADDLVIGPADASIRACRSSQVVVVMCALGSVSV